MNGAEWPIASDVAAQANVGFRGAAEMGGTVSLTSVVTATVIRRPAPAYCHTVARLFTCTALTRARPLYPPKQTFIARIGMSA